TLQIIPRPVAMPTASQAGHHVASVSSYASTGLSFHVVLERGTKVASEHTKSTPEVKAAPVSAARQVSTPLPALEPAVASYIIRVGAGTLGELAAKVKHLATGNQAATLLAAAGQARFTARDRARLAIVATDA